MIGEFRFMDMLYARYSCPMDLMSRYINQRRFGDFVRSFMEAENDRRKAEKDKDEEWMMWTAYLHSHSDKSYNDWKREILGGSGQDKKKSGGDADLDDAGIKNILDRLFPMECG